MSDRADELLLEVCDAQDAYAGAGPRIDDRTNAQRLQQAFAAARAYLNEKPHEPSNELLENMKQLPVSEPEKPVAWTVRASHDGSYCQPTLWRQDAEHFAYGQRELHPGVTWTVIPLYAAVQPPTYTEMVQARDTLNLRIAEIELLDSFGKP